MNTFNKARSLSLSLAMIFVLSSSAFAGNTLAAAGVPETPGEQLKTAGTILLGGAPSYYFFWSDQSKRDAYMCGGAAVIGAGLLVAGAVIDANATSNKEKAKSVINSEDGEFEYIRVPKGSSSERKTKQKVVAEKDMNSIQEPIESESGIR